MIWLLKNWKVVALGLVCVALVWTGIKLYRAGAAQATLTHELATQTALADKFREQAAQFAKSLRDHNERSLVDAQKITELTKRNDGLNDYVETLRDADRECLSADDVERVRDLWN